MSKDTDPTKPTPNSEKFKPQNVADAKDGNPNNQYRQKPGDTEGMDIEQGSSGVTKKTPSA